MKRASWLLRFLLITALSAACRGQVPTLADCTDDAGCSGEACRAGKCRPPRCVDGRVNGRETDVDCGGGYCVPCAAKRVCLDDGDCESGVCTLHHCAPASCSDQVRNGDETEVDCGGSCRPCESVEPTCTDGRRTGTETDVDCGGTACGRCDDGKLCGRNADCKSGACADGKCGNPCPAPLRACNGACVDAQVDRFNCGSCGAGCTGDAVCVGGNCTLACLGGSRQCGATCVDPGSNPAHCGGCNRPCGAFEICVGGMCLAPCPVGQVVCSGACVSIDRDPVNCGGCGRGCDPRTACVMGSCTLGCALPLVLCDGGASCVDPRYDPGNCGGCGLPCLNAPHAARACVSGVCSFLGCQPGFEDCNALPLDGCEAELAVDPANCGICSRACLAGDACLFGRCCGPLPAGSYQQSCVGCEACEGVLTCLCRDAAQVQVPASIPLGVCPAGYANCNGVLQCGGC